MPPTPNSEAQNSSNSLSHACCKARKGPKHTLSQEIFAWSCWSLTCISPTPTLSDLGLFWAYKGYIGAIQGLPIGLRVGALAHWMVVENGGMDPYSSPCMNPNNIFRASLPFLHSLLTAGNIGTTPHRASQ